VSQHRGSSLERISKSKVKGTLAQASCFPLLAAQAGTGLDVIEGDHGDNLHWILERNLDRLIAEPLDLHDLGKSAHLPGLGQRDATSALARGLGQDAPDGTWSFGDRPCRPS
jgi:hypothetical protein